MTLPHQYDWLAKLVEDPGTPKAIVEAVKLYGTLEKPGTASNPVIIAFADEIAAKYPTDYNRFAAKFYDDDGIAWCGLGHAVCHVRAGRPPVEKYLAALSWKNFGVAVDHPMLGDTMVKPRFSGSGKLIGGHVTFNIGEDGEHFYGLGANQADAFNIEFWPKSQFKWFRRPVYRVQPANVKINHLSPGGTMTGGSEA